MEETVAFKSQDGHFEFVVKKEFTLTVPDFEKIATHDLFTKHHIFKHLHNPNGPAVTHLKLADSDPGKELYWLNGRPVEDEETKKRMKHNKSFSDQMDKVLNDDGK